MAYQIHLFLVLPLKVWTGNKAEVYNVRQIPALHICITRTRIIISAVRQRFPCKSVFSVLLYAIVTGMNRPSLRMC